MLFTSVPKKPISAHMGQPYTRKPKRVLNPSNFEPEGHDIIVVRYEDGAEVSKADIEAMMNYVQKEWPNRKLLLIDHQASFSFSSDAIVSLATMPTYFLAICSLTYSDFQQNAMLALFNILNLSIPFDVVRDKSAAISFLRNPISQH